MVDRRQAGFSLPAFLVAQALTLGLITAVISFTTALIDDAAASADVAELAERSRHALAVLASEVALAGARPQPPPGSPVLPVVESVPESMLALADIRDPCRSPVGESVNLSHASLRVVAAGTGSCLPSADLGAAAMLVIDAIRDCSSGCAGGDPAFVVLVPGCHPLFTRTSIEVRLTDPASLPGDCAPGTAHGVLERTVYWIRDYAWTPGDGIPALMQRRLAPELPLRWLRSEMLVAGVAGWSVAERDDPRPAASCLPGVPCAVSRPLAGVDIGLLLQGWYAGHVLPGSRHHPLGAVSLGPFSDGVMRLAAQRLMLRSGFSG